MTRFPEGSIDLFMEQKKPFARIENVALNSNPEENPRKTTWIGSPIFWLLGGILFTILIGAIGLLVFRYSLDERISNGSEVAGQPTIIRITAPATPIPSATPIIPTPTSIPTLTPSPTPDRLIAPDEIIGGFFAQVANTDDVGVNFRNGFGRSNELISVLDEGTIGLVIDGPVEEDGFIWWRIELEDGVRGWLVEQFLVPAGQPLDWRQ